MNQQTRESYSISTLWLPLAISFAAFIAIGAQDGTLGVLLPSLQRQYELSKGAVSYLFFASTFGYLVAAFTSGLLVEWLGRRLFLTLGGVALLLGNALVVTVPSWYAVLAALLCVGFGIAVVDAGLNTYVASLPNNTAKLNYLHAFYGVGALIGPLLASTIIGVGLRWNRVYAVLATIALLLALSFASMFRRAQGTQAESHGEQHATGNVMAATLRLPIVWIAAVFLLLYVGVEVSIGSWTFSFLTEERGEGVLLAGRLVSSYWGGLTLGRLVLGGAAKRLGNTRLIQLCLAGLVVGLLLLWIGRVWIVAALGLALAGFSLGPIFPTMIAVIAQLVPSRLLPSTIGFMTSLGAAGAAFFPWIAGTLANQFGVWVILPYAMAIAVVLLGCWLLFQYNAAHVARQQAERVHFQPSDG